MYPMCGTAQCHVSPPRSQLWVLLVCRAPWYSTVCHGMATAMPAGASSLLLLACQDVAIVKGTHTMLQIESSRHITVVLGQ